MAKRIKIGDILEIKTSKGYAYMQYTHKDIGTMGSLVRVFNGIYDKQLEELDILKDKDVQFITFFPLQFALNKGIVNYLGNMELRDEFRVFPIFKSMLGQDLKTNKAKSWNIWEDGKVVNIIYSPLSKEEKMIPNYGVINDTMLIYKIETNFTEEQSPLL